MNVKSIWKKSVAIISLISFLPGVDTGKPDLSIPGISVDLNTEFGNVDYLCKNDFDYISSSLLFVDDRLTTIEYRYSLTNTAIIYSSARVLIKNETYPEGKLIYSKSNDSYKDTKTFTYSNKYTCSTGNSLLFQLYEKTTLIKEVILDVQVCDCRKIEPPSLKDSLFKSVSSVQYKNQNIKYTYDTLKFDGFDTFYVPNYYQMIDFSKFKFSFSTVNKKVEESTTYAVVCDTYGFFSDIGTLGENNNITLKCNLVYKDGWYFPEIIDPLYVDVLTMEMNRDKKQGYVATKYLFLPRNEMKKQTEFSIKICIENVGINNYQIEHNVNVHSLLNIFGDCSNSEYCINTIDDGSNFEYGKDLL